MSTTSSKFTQRMREGMGLAAKTVDSDLVAGLAKLEELERDVNAMKRVLQTTNSLMTTTLPNAQTGLVSVFADVSGKLLGPDLEAATFVKVHADVHKYMCVARSCAAALSAHPGAARGRSFCSDEDCRWLTWRPPLYSLLSLELDHR